MRPWTLALILFGMGCSTMDVSSTPDERPTNIILIMADDLGYGELGSYGQTKIRTPRLDQIAEEGLRFTQFYSGSPVCASSRCVLLTGLHTGHCYVRGNDEFPKGVDVWRDRTLEGQRPLLAGTRSLGTLLQDHGYKTAAIGKWGLGAAESTGHPNLQGFDFFYGYLCQRQAHNHYPTHLWRNEQKHMLEGNLGHGHAVGRHYAHDLMTEEILTFVRENRDNPFFLYIPFHIPHVAVQVPEDSLSEYDGAFEETPYEADKGYLPHPRPRAGYAAMITRMDRDIGRLMDLLVELDLDENTMVMFTSDNGPTWAGGADSEFFESAAGLRGLKGSLYEGGIRVPLLVRWKGTIPEGEVLDHVCASWDLLPTLVEVAGHRPPEDVDGLSLLPTLLGKSGQVKHESLYWEFRKSQAVRLGDWKALRHAGGDQKMAVELYDLSNDRAESKDVAAEHPQVVEKIAAIMNARTESAIDKWNFAPIELSP